MSITIHSPADVPVIVIEAPTRQEVAQFIARNRDTDLKFARTHPVRTAV